MTENTKIQWATHSWNPWVGCTKVSDGCDHCYAEAWAKRAGADVWGPHKARRRTSAAYWRQPLKWDREASTARDGERPRVFPSLCDPFDAEADSELRWQFWFMVQSTPHLDWLLLTKRPNLVQRMVPPHWLDGAWPANVWIGTSVETAAQRWRLEKLYEVRARVEIHGGRIPVLFGSFEPLLADVNLSDRVVPVPWRPFGTTYAHLVDWGIFGGESGGLARPCDLQWIRDGRDALHAAGKKVFVKQVGRNPVAACKVHGISCGGHKWPWNETEAQALGKEPRPRLRDSHGGGDPSEWPEDLRVREMPR